MLASLSLGALYAGARTGLAPRDTSNGIAVVFAPWTAPEAVLSRAVEGGSRFVRFGGLPFIAIVMPEDADYAARMLGAGAWIVADPQTIAACLSAIAAQKS